LIFILLYITIITTTIFIIIMSSTIDPPPSYEEAIRETSTRDASSIVDVQNHQVNQINQISNEDFTDSYIKMLLIHIKMVISDDNATEIEKDKQISNMNKLIKFKMNNHPKLSHIELIDMVDIRDKLKAKFEIKKFISYNEYVTEVRAKYPSLSYMEARTQATKTYFPIKEERIITEFHAEFIEEVRDRKRTYVKILDETITRLKKLYLDLSKDGNPELNWLNWNTHLAQVSQANPQLDKTSAFKKAKELYKPLKTFAATRKLYLETVKKGKTDYQYKSITNTNLLNKLIHYLENKLFKLTNT
jgi:hypothetical protein